MAKVHFSTAPNYYSGMNTKHIMRDLTITLAVVSVFAVLFYSINYQLMYGLRVIGLLAVSVAISVAVETVWCLAVKKDKDVLGYLSTSFPWITALILTLMCPVDVTYYSLIVSTVFAIVFGKLVYGGFGQNIFNPAIVGRIFMVVCFGSQSAADVVTSATPTLTMSTTYGWLINDSVTAGQLLEQFGGLSSLFWGTYTGAMGETSAILILLAGGWLLYRRDIDWHAPFAFILTIACCAGIVALRFDTGIWYVLFHLLTGGVMFGAVFMVTEPVTSPTSVAGQLLFGIGCGFITIVIRLFGNLPEGVMYSILIMNMFTPLLDHLTAGAQDVMKRRNFDLTAAAFAGALIIIGITSGSLTAYDAKNDGFLDAEKPLPLNDSYQANEAVILSKSDNIDTVSYRIEVKGYASLSADNEYAVKSPNIIEVSINKKDGTVWEISYEKLSDNQYGGNKTETDRFLSQFIGQTSEGSVDAVSGATATSSSVAAAVARALADYQGGGN